MTNQRGLGGASQPAQQPTRTAVTRLHRQRSRSLDSSLPRFVWPAQQQMGLNQQRQGPPPPYIEPQPAALQPVAQQQQHNIAQNQAERANSPQQQQQQQQELNLQREKKKQTMYIPDFNLIHPGEDFSRGMTPSPEPIISHAEVSSAAPELMADPLRAGYS